MAAIDWVEASEIGESVRSVLFATRTDWGEQAVVQPHWSGLRPRRPEQEVRAATPRHRGLQGSRSVPSRSVFAFGQSAVTVVVHLTDLDCAEVGQIDLVAQLVRAKTDAVVVGLGLDQHVVGLERPYDADPPG